MRDFSASPREMIASLWRNRNLIMVLSRREVIGRYRGSFLGLLWSFFNPIFMLAVYTFVFSEVFNARWNEGSNSKTEFALVLFAGLIVFNFFSECISRAPALILSNANLVKKVVFPLEILPWVAVASSLFHFSVSFLVWLIAYFIFFGIPPITSLLVPLILVPLMFLVLGLSWFLAALGVFLRDVGQLIGVIITVLLFMSPIFYPVSALPEKFQGYLLWNPLTPAIEQIRKMIYWGVAPEWNVIVIYSIMTALIAWFGFIWFQKTRKGFADVL